MIEHHWLRALAIGDRPGLNGSVIGHGSHLAAHNLAAFYRCIGRTDESRQYESMATRLRTEAERLTSI